MKMSDFDSADGGNQLAGGESKEKKTTGVSAEARNRSSKVKTLQHTYLQF